MFHLFIIIIVNFCIRCNINSIPSFFFFCLWISNHPSTFCWKDSTFSIEIFLHLCQKSVGRTCVGLFLVLYPILLACVSISVPRLHGLGYCAMCVLSHLVVSDSLQFMHCSPPDFSVHGISEGRIMEWVAISYSRGSSLTGMEPTSPH